MVRADFSAEGGCACGGVRYRLTAKPLFVHCCHCRWCQRETGSAFALNAMIETDRVDVLKGAALKVLTPSESGKGQTIMRCPECKVALWSHYAGAGEKVAFVRVGTLDDPNVAPPDVHIYTAFKQDWVAIPEGVPACREYYEWREEWPQASQARREGLKKSAAP